MLTVNNSTDLISKIAGTLGKESWEIVSKLDYFDKYPRYYHGANHILDLCQKIYKERSSSTYLRFLILVALFHDYVYDPKSKNNERESAEVFKQEAWSYKLAPNEIDLIYATILDTKDHVARNPLSELFIPYDLSGFAASNEEILENEKLIRKEYAWVDWADYKKGKLEFLAKYRELPIVKSNKQIQGGMDWLAQYITKEEAPNIGIYAGSFNPFHVGHKNILEKAEKIFDKVVVAVGQNPEKLSMRDGPRTINNLDTVEYLKYHQVDVYHTSLPRYFKEKSYTPTLIRGLRNTTDLQAELNQLRWLQAIDKNIKVVYIVCDKEFEHISSSAIRSLRNFEDLNALGYDNIKVKVYDK